MTLYYTSVGLICTVILLGFWRIARKGTHPWRIPWPPIFALTAVALCSVPLSSAALYLSNHLMNPSQEILGVIGIASAAAGALALVAGMVIGSWRLVVGTRGRTKHS